MISEKIHILDSGVFLSGAQSAFMDKPCITTYGVVTEMKSGRAAIEMDRALLSGLQAIEPTSESTAKAETARKKTQDKLSKTDISLVALALDFKKKGKDAAVVSDDYGVQNLCKALGVEFIPIAREGIKNRIEWTGKCRACGLKTNEKICPHCGSAVKFGAKIVH